MVKIKGKIFKTGSSYAMTIPKALVEAGLIANGERLELEMNMRAREDSNLFLFSSENNTLLSYALEGAVGVF